MKIKTIQQTKQNKIKQKTRNKKQKTKNKKQKKQTNKQTNKQRRNIILKYCYVCSFIIFI